MLDQHVRRALEASAGQDRGLGRERSFAFAGANTNARHSPALVALERSDGAQVRLACSWRAPIGQGAIIEVRCLGTEGGATWRNLGGSFYDFEIDFHRGDVTERLGGAPDDWSARALGAWIDRLRIDRSFDPDISGVAQTAALIDEAYGR